ncbi:MAG: bifunctional 2-polyprenyl-6-hydroxyphenol methylase/3-demethylubiquinol 3-O-methyltransferase UbiG [Deltaproteobacteria bacterium]
MANPHPFDSFKDDWWNPEGRLKSLHRIIPLRFEYFSARIKEELGTFEGKKILDVGCGGGLISERFASEGALVTGIDVSTPSIEAAKEHAAKHGLKIDYCAIEVSSFSTENKGVFDCVVSSEVLEHVENLPEFIKDAASTLKKGGLFLFSTINKTIMAKFLAIFMAEDVLRILPKGTHDYKKFIKPSELARFLRENSVVVKDVRGISLSLSERGFKISKDTSVNYIGYGVKQ